MKPVLECSKTGLSEKNIKIYIFFKIKLDTCVRFGILYYNTHNNLYVV